MPDAGEVRLLEYIVNKTSPTNLVLHLYSNDVDLSTETFTSASFTQPTAAGYSSVTLTGACCNASTTAGVSTALYDEAVTFNFSAGQDVQGYYVTDVSNNIMWAEEFPGAPFQLPSGGGDIAIRPQVQLN